RSPTSTLSLHDALPIWRDEGALGVTVHEREDLGAGLPTGVFAGHADEALAGCVPGDDLSPRIQRQHRRAALRHGSETLVLGGLRSEEHTSELQSRENLV